MKIEHCPEGHDAELHTVIFGIEYYVECDEDWCWSGPKCREPKLAVKKWNTVMRRFQTGDMLMENMMHDRKLHYAQQKENGK